MTVMFKLLTGVKIVTPVALVTGILVVPGLVGIPAYAEDVPPSGFPSWAEVQAAKDNEADTAAQVQKITGLLGELSSRSEQLGTAAVNAGETYAANQQALDQAVSRSEVLAEQEQRAAEEAVKLRSEAGALAAQMYKNGGSGLGVMASLADLQQPDALQQAGLMGVVSDNAAKLLGRSEVAEKYLTSLKDQQQQSMAERERLTAETKDSLDSVSAAQRAAEAEVSQQQQNSDTLKAQLASLTNTTVDTENKYQQGVEAQRAYQAVQQAKEAAAAQARATAAENARQAAQREAQNNRGSGNVVAPLAPQPPGPQPPPVVVPPVTPPSGGAVNDPAGAQAYASASLGSFGWGQDQFSCLVSLWTRESNWLTTATNPSSGAYGIPQSLPAGKMADAGADWLTNYRTQVNWGLNYIKGRYGSPCAAWGHSQSVGWY